MVRHFNISNMDTAPAEGFTWFLQKYFPAFYSSSITGNEFSMYAQGNSFDTASDIF